MSDAHRVTVVVPTLGRPTLARCLAGLECQTRRADELLVIEDRARRGPSWARNTGLRRASGDLVAFLDDDLVPPPEWLAALVAALERHDADGAGGSYVESDPLLAAVRRRRPVPVAECLDPGGLVGIGGNLLLRRAALERLVARDGHAFDEALPTGEDWDLAHRLRRDGARLVWVPQAAPLHLRRARPLGYLRHQFVRGLGIAGMHRRQQADAAAPPMQDSLLWGAGGRRHAPRWGAALWRKAVGPFDPRGFARRRDFALYWLGEKAQGAGFLWGLRRGAPTPRSRR